MTPTLINMASAPGRAEITGMVATPGAATAQSLTGTPDAADPQTFVVAMAALASGPDDGVSGTLLPPALAVTGSGPVVPAISMDLGLRPTPDALMIGELVEPVTGLFDESGVADSPFGVPLPGTGNTLPPGTGFLDLPPSAPALNRDGVVPITVNPALLHQSVIDPAQTAAASVTLRPPVLDSQLSLNAAPPATTIIDANDSATPMPRANSAHSAMSGPGLETDLRMAGEVQRTGESTMITQTESAPLGRSVATAPIATLNVDSSVAALAQPVSSTSMPLNPLTELPQFQNMRPLQPNADPQAFTSGLGQRLMMMSDAGVQSARLQLYPENLGSLDVRIRIEDDTVRVWFAAQHGQAREALEAALPKLRELFAQQGMELVQADVGSGDDQRDASEAFDRLDDASAQQAHGESGLSSESVGRPKVVAWSERSLDIYV